MAINPLWTADEFEFLELRNTSNQPIDFTAAQFVVGHYVQLPHQRRDHAGAANPAVLVRDLTAFDAQYRADRRVAGTYTGKLDNNGEELRLLDQSGQPIFDFTYQDSGAWPGRAGTARAAAWN